MGMRNVVGSLLTLASIGLGDVRAVEPQDSTRVSSDTLKVCISDNPVLGPGVYLDLPNRRIHSATRSGNYFDDAVLPQCVGVLISDGNCMGIYIKESFIRQRFGISSNVFVQDLPSRFNEFSHRTFSFTRLAGVDETDLGKFLDGYMGYMEP